MKIENETDIDQLKDGLDVIVFILTILSFVGAMAAINDFKNSVIVGFIIYLVAVFIRGTIVLLVQKNYFKKRYEDDISNQ